MVKTLIPVPGLIHGVSEQPPAMRLPSQLERCDNAYPSEARGLSKRNPLEHVAKLYDGTMGESLVHFIDRDTADGERYVVLANTSHGTNAAVRVFDLAGKELGVYGPAAGVPDFSYLDIATSDNLLDTGTETFVAGATDEWTDLNGANNAPLNIPLNGPFGFPGTIQEIGSEPGAVGAILAKGPTSSYLLRSFGADGLTFSVYVHEATGATIAATKFKLDLHDDSNDEPHSATFSWAAGDLKLISHNGGANAIIERLPAGWWRAAVTFAPGWGGNTTAVDQVEVRIEVPEFNASLQRVVAVWGAMLNSGTTPLPYLGEPSKAFKALTVADYTLFLNTDTTVALDSTLSAASDFASKAFLFVRQGAYNTTYEVLLKRTGNAEQVASLTTWDGSSASNVREQWTVTINTLGTVGAAWSVSCQGASASYTQQAGDVTTALVAEGLKNAIDALGNVSASRSGSTITVLGDFKGMDFTVAQTGVATTGTMTVTNTVPQTNAELAEIDTTQIATDLASKINALTGFDAESHGSVVMVTATSNNLESLTTKDGLGDQGMYSVWKSVEAVDKLPKFFLDGRKVKVSGATADTGDDLYVKFVANVSGGWSEGTWVECEGFAVKTTIDADTMPHQLVRLFDDAPGTVTGTPFEPYFEWGPVAWEPRAAGDDESNPGPSIVGAKISSLFFHRNRLGFIGGAQVVMSEAARYFGLWRTSVTQLLDADPIDITVTDGPQVIELTHALPFDERLLLFAEEAVFTLDGQPLLTPTTAQAKFALALKASSKVTPVAADASAVFAWDREAHTSVSSVSASTTIEGRMVPSNITAHVPRYLPPGAKQIVPCLSEKCLVFLTGLENQLHVYKYYDVSEQRVQSAWVRFIADPLCLFKGGHAFQNRLYLVTQHDTEVCLEFLDLDPTAVDTGLSHKIMIDRRVALGFGTAYPGTYYPTYDETLYQLPYSSDSPETMIAVQENGTRLVVTAIYETVDCPNFIGIRGNHEREVCYVGQPYLMEVVLTEPVLRTDSGPILAARATARKVRVSFHDTAGFTMKATDGLRHSTHTFDPHVLGEAVLSIPGYETGVADLPIFLPARKLRVSIENATPYPSNFGGAEWEIEAVGRNGVLS